VLVLLLRLAGGPENILKAPVASICKRRRHMGRSFRLGDCMMDFVSTIQCDPVLRRKGAGRADYLLCVQPA
jgi:hypothetical protein